MHLGTNLIFFLIFVSIPLAHTNIVLGHRSFVGGNMTLYCTPIVFALVAWYFCVLAGCYCYYILHHLRIVESSVNCYDYQQAYLNCFHKSFPIPTLTAHKITMPTSATRHSVFGLNSLFMFSFIHLLFFLYRHKCERCDAHSQL